VAGSGTVSGVSDAGLACANDGRCRRNKVALDQSLLCGCEASALARRTASTTGTVNVQWKTCESLRKLSDFILTNQLRCWLTATIARSRHRSSAALEDLEEVYLERAPTRRALHQNMFYPREGKTPSLDMTQFSPKKGIMLLCGPPPPWLTTMLGSIGAKFCVLVE
jgi:hypothetical protein